MGAATWTEGTSRAVAVASSSVIVSWLPEPRRTPPAVTLPDNTIIRFEPRLWICSATRACARADHGDHGVDADDDAEHRERAPELVDAERPNRNPHALSGIHDRDLRSDGVGQTVRLRRRL